MTQADLTTGAIAGSRFVHGRTAAEELCFGLEAGVDFEPNDR
jgi:hypothetical protein